MTEASRGGLIANSSTNWLLLDVWECSRSGANGTYFLTEYMVCQDRSNICVFDSRGILEVERADGLAVLKNWMVQGVCNGQMVIRSVA